VTQEQDLQLLRATRPRQQPPSTDGKSLEPN
jgi:hypothetical protein